jgi:hypothetical protein
MAERKRPAWWRGRVVAVLAVLALAGIVAGKLVANGNIFQRPLPPYPQIVGKQCGTLTAGARGTAGDFTASEQCLWHAYQTCQAATLVYNEVGLDFTETHAVSEQPHGARCSVTDATQGQQDGSGQTTQTSYQCRGMEQQARGLVMLGCGAEGDITIPASASMALGVGAGAPLSW